MPEKQKGRIGRRLAEFFEIPLDAVPDWPRIVLNANQSVEIKNHRGIIEYDQALVRIGTKMGEIRITGQRLTLVAAIREEITVEGKVERVELVDWR